MRIMLFLSLLSLIFSCVPEESSDNQQSDADFIEGLYDQVLNNEIDSFVTHITDTLEWIMANGVEYTNKEDVYKHYSGSGGGIWEYWSLAEMTFSDVEGDKVLVRGRYQAKCNANDTILIDAPFVHYWELTEGKVSKFQQYTDTKQISDAATLCNKSS